MKKIILLFTLFFNLSLSAKEAVVIAFQAPLLKEKRDDATVYEYVRKGRIIYIQNSLDFSQPLPKYIETFDQTGNTAYIRSNYIKVVTNDSNEYLHPISVGKHDVTDYRIEEPIPVTYPFSDHTWGKISLDFTMGNNPFDPYQYGNSLFKQEASFEKGFKLLITRKVSFDDTDRYYFGLISGFSYVQNNIIFTNAFSAKELRTLFRIGPYFSYDAFRTGKYRFSIATGLTYNIHKSSIFVEDTEFYLSEEKEFSGTSISPLASVNFEITKFIPGVDLVMGSDVYFYLPHSQSGPKTSTFPQLWTDNQIKSSTKAQVALFIGIQTRF